MKTKIFPGDFATVDHYDFVLQLLNRGFKYLDHGAFRHTFVRGRVVIKVPRGNLGITDNRTEALAYRKWKSHPTEKGLILAPCRLLPNDCLMMVTVDLEHEWNGAPPWVYRIEGAQAGLYKGHWVAYDYAYDVKV